MTAPGTTGGGGVQDGLAQASRLRAAGRHGEARAVLDGLLAREPGNPALLNALGLTALAGGERDAAIRYHRRATDAAPHAPPLWLNLAVALRAAGQAEAELSALERALGIDPTFMPALLAKAAVLDRLGRAADSAAAYRACLLVARDEEALPPPVRAALARGREVVAADDAARASRHEGAIDAALAAHAGEDLCRAQAWRDALFGRRKLYTQQPTGPLFPFLPAIEYHDRAHFPWFAALEAGWTAIRDELLAIWDDGRRAFEPYVQMADGSAVQQWAELNRSPRWGAWFLWRSGVKQEAECAACPQTAALLESLPMLDIPGVAPTAMFSILDANTRIPPHTGTSNVRLTVHLPLVVPPGCGFRVGGDVREWREGEAWAFDDTIEHEAWNNSDRPRAILILDAWNPLLTEAERDVVRASAPAMRL